MKCVGTLFCLVLAGCGFVPSESKLVGTWQVDLPPRQKLVYTFQTNHTYTMAISGQTGVVQGTWKLSGSMLTTTMVAFSGYGMTNTLSAVKGMNSQKNAITRLTDATMVWRNFLGAGLKLRRVATGSSAGPAPP
jgi:hypothetical protein